ncbi:2Fe-2S iron-sulfur cluster-binding protein [Methylocystis heyeri]|uniref:2Fe-2S iron-sulfur cluster binding domain-containing protein n=1 Tax=Methylocystis heyeri TaxID=391905 RepID=A0A6B8KIG9_9HYPH|nr:2Fe-2S iron-sulfur cluster-binding protein [Methylocystis heyeri]QGM48196.1 2Fe-2S iron-sulfur cluster binding domain-containing protein [Methylocystis heyeri]
MSLLTYEDRPVDIAPGETVLEALLRAGIDAPSSCRTGNCQTCMHRVVAGTPPEDSQSGLTEAQKAIGLFLPCICKPKAPLTIVSRDDAGASIDAVVHSIERVSHDIVRLRVEAEKFEYRPGQFLELIAGADLKRHYSLASHPEDDPYLEMHIRLHENGRMSRRLTEALEPGHRLHVAGPSGTCFYEGVDAEQPLVLIGAGTGLAPLYGVLRDALKRGHRGPIRLYHGARDSRGLYLRDELEVLAAARDNLVYRPCALDLNAPLGGDVAALALDAETEFEHSAFFLCGGVNLVNRLKHELFMRGASLRSIRFDAFIPAG